jgi:diguanylate cyclase (GGDEF)-like protein
VKISKITATNRILVVDDDSMIVEEYLRCLGGDFEPDLSESTLGDLEKVLFGEETDESGGARFEVHSCNQGAAAVDTVRQAVGDGNPFSIVFIDIRMPPGIDGIEAGKQIREIDPNVNIVVVTGSLSPEPAALGRDIPPADRVFFFKKPFHSIECRQLAAALCGKWHADLALRHANDVPEQKVCERTEALHRLAYFDPVTELPNKLKLVDELQSLIDQAAASDTDSAVVLLDLERFSFLNETMGYESGSELLRAVGRRLLQFVERLDAQESSIVGRFGADEFACLIAGIRNNDMLEDIVSGIKANLEKPFVILGREIHLKASIGIAWHPVHGRDASTVFRCAEAAMHRSMRNLQSGVTYYHPEMQHTAQHKFDMESEFRLAVDKGEISTWFQPQLCLKSGRIPGVEALARWQRPGGDMVQPADFVPLSEEMGISDLLFESVMGYVCGAVARWREDQGWQVPVIVNLSAHQLRNHQLTELIKTILSRKNIDQKLINLELTETALLEDLKLARPVLADLSSYGVGIHIDDFGTGYSSLSYLAELPVQTLKIDQSFVGRLTESDTNAKVVQAIIALGKAMNLNVIAEGVETEQQLKLVSEFGCDLA